MPRNNLDACLNEIFGKLTSLAERVAKLEARSELYTPFPHVHDLFTQVKNELSAVRESLARQEAEAEADVEDLREIRKRLDDIEGSLQKMAKEHREYRDGELVREQENLVNSLEKLKEQVTTLKNKTEGSKPSWLSARWSAVEARLTSTQKIVAALVSIGAALWGLVEFWLSYAPVASAIVHDVLEAIRHAPR
jgi:chromosome segregation ATPase